MKDFEHCLRLVIVPSLLLLFGSLSFADDLNDERGAVNVGVLWRSKVESGSLEVRISPNRIRWHGGDIDASKHAFELVLVLKDAKSGQAVYSRDRIGELSGVIMEGLAANASKVGVDLRDNYRVEFMESGDVKISMSGAEVTLSRESAASLSKSVYLHNLKCFQGSQKVERESKGKDSR